jgi:membrane fusion protein, multidrug efflux system
VDAQTRERGPSAEETRPPRHSPEEADSGGTREPETGDRQRTPENRAASIWDRLREHWLPAIVIAGIVMIVAIGGVAYWLDIRHYESTDDAFVAARIFSVAPKVGGYVVDVPVTDNQHVEAGEPLARIDDRDYRVGIDQAEAQVAAAAANKANIEAQINTQQAQIEQSEAQLQQAEAQLQFAEQKARRHLPQ